MYWFIKIELRKSNFSGAKKFFYIIFDFKNGCKNEFKDNNEKSYSRSRNRVSRKIDFKVQWLRNSHADSVGVLYYKDICWIFQIKSNRTLYRFLSSPESSTMKGLNSFSAGLRPCILRSKKLTPQKIIFFLACTCSRKIFILIHLKDSDS